MLFGISPKLYSFQIKLISLTIFFSITAVCEESYQGNIQLLLGNRNYVVDFLETTFGKENVSGGGSELYAEQNGLFPTSVEYILKHRSFWGGPCDIYEMSENDQGNLERPEQRCHMVGSDWNNPFYSSSSIVREGYRIKSCEEILDNKSAIEFALNNVGLVISDPVDFKNVSELYKYFYPLRKLNTTSNKEAIDSLVAINTDLNDLEKGWQMILITLCYDPAWQVL